LLLVAYFGARGYGALMSRRELRRFEQARVAVENRRSAYAVPGKTSSVPLPSPSPADTRLWSTKRIRAYEESARANARAPLAVLRIPKIRLEVAVLDGTDDLTLNRAVGRIDGTARPGEPGNIGIAGHRDGFFRGLKDLARGDPVEFVTLSGVDSYVVDDIRIVDPTEVRVLEPTAVPALTLVTCYPFYHVGAAPKRFIVRAVKRAGS
jgi:sortase A